MNIANVTSRFALLAGLDNGEIYKWRTLIEDACDYVGSILRKKDNDDTENRRIEMLCAVYALRLYSLCNEDNITSFTAGDVKLTSSANGKQNAQALWEDYAKQSSDLIRTEGFLFGRVV